MTKKPIPAWMAPSTVVTLVVTTSTTSTSEKSVFQSVGRHMLLLHAVEQAADAGDRAGEREDDDALPGRVDAEARRGRLAPPHGRQVPADRPLAHQEHDDDGDDEDTPCERRNMA